MKAKHLLALFILITVFSCKKKSDDETQSPAPQPVQRHVTYKISCSDCQVSYYKSGMVQGTEDHKNSTWSYSFDGVKGDVVLLFAYNTSSAPQGVNTTIMLNNDTLVSRTTYCPISGYSFVTDTLE